jgi:hypothetical protein
MPACAAELQQFFFLPGNPLPMLVTLLVPSNHMMLFLPETKYKGMEIVKHHLFKKKLS